MTELFRFPDLPGLFQVGASGPLWFLAGVFAAIVLYHLVVSVQTHHPAMGWLGFYAAALSLVLLTPMDSRVLGIPAPWQRVFSVLLALGMGSGLTAAALELDRRPGLRIGLFTAYGLVVGWCALAFATQSTGLLSLPFPEPIATAGLLALVILNTAVAAVAAGLKRRREQLLYLLAWATGLAALPMVWLEGPQQAGQSPAGWLLLAHILLLAFALAERVNALSERLRHAEAIETGQRALFGRVERLATTHIHAALGAAELLRAAPRREYLGIVERSVQGLLRDMNVAEANAALARGDYFTARESTDLYLMVHHLLTGLSPLANAKRLALYAVIDPVLPARIHTDLRHLRCLLGMALEQGLRHCTGAEVILRVDADADADRPSSARFAIIGAQAAVSGGWRDDDVQDWLRRMALALGGRQGLNAKGSRLELWFQLPVLDSQQTAVPASPAVEMEPGRLLIVDAHDVFRNTAARIMRNLGHEVDAAASVEDAIAVHTAAAAAAEPDELAADLPAAAPARDWLWDNEATAPAGSVTTARALSEPAPPRRRVRYDRLLIGATVQERDDSPVSIEKLRQAGISAASTVAMLPLWQTLRGPAVVAGVREPGQSRSVSSERGGLPDATGEDGLAALSADLAEAALPPDELIRAGIAREAAARSEPGRDAADDLDSRRDSPLGEALRSELRPDELRPKELGPNESLSRDPLSGDAVSLDPVSLEPVLPDPESRDSESRNPEPRDPEPRDRLSAERVSRDALAGDIGARGSTAGVPSSDQPAGSDLPVPDRMVWIYRPLLVSDLPAELARAETEVPDPIRGLRAVLAIADEDLAAVVAGLLQSLGCKVNVADNGRLLLHRYTRGRHGLIPGYDLVVLEDSDEGRDSAQQIREFEASRGPYRVCIAALTRPAETGGDRKVDGFDVAVPLPLTLGRIRAAVHRAARVREEKRAEDASRADLPI